jgi:hypothetical protein
MSKMEDMSIVTEMELESQELTDKKSFKSHRKPSGDDPVSDYLLKLYYAFSSPSMLSIKLIIFLSPFITILLFNMFISSTTSNTIAFTSLIVLFFPFPLTPHFRSP